MYCLMTPIRASDSGCSKESLESSGDGRLQAAGPPGNPSL